MSPEHHIIYIPGLRDQGFLNKNLIKLLPYFWEPQGFKLHIIAPHWENGDKFSPKLRLICDKVDKLKAERHFISIIGQSAGGSAALNVYCDKKSTVTGVVNVTGRLCAGVNVKPTLAKASRISPAFKESVLLFEQKNKPKLTLADKRRIMTIRPLWDETVPASTVSIEGATNLVAPIIEHSLGGIFIVTFYAKKIQKFLRGLENLPVYRS